MPEPEPTPFLTSLAHHAADPFRLLVEAVVDYAIFMIDPGGNVASWNPGAERIYGYAAQEIVGQPVSRFSADEGPETGPCRRGLETVLQEGRLELECRRLRADGSTFWAIVTTTNLKDYFGNHVGFAQVTRDITERKLLIHTLGERVKELTCLHGAAQVLHDDELSTADWLREVAGLVPPAWQYPAETEARIAVGKLEHATPGFERTPWLQRAEFSCAEDTPCVIEVVYRTEKPPEVEGPFLAEERHLIDSLTEMLRSALDRRHAEAALAENQDQLRQAQKMEAIGHLAGGVAHDFNNLLTVINGYSDLLLHTLAENDPARSCVADIYKAGERAVALTQQLLTFSRRQILQPKVLDLNIVLSDTESLLRRLIGEDIVLTILPGPALGSVKIDPGQVQQVLINLAVNARDAMLQGGRLTFETCNATLDEVYARTHPEVTPGRYSLLAVSDSGTGMDEGTMSHAFEPFFTTKAPGNGTGLGLAVVHGVVRQNRGHIEVHSEVGQGTTFKIYLPQVQEAVSPGESTDAGTMPRGTETVLLAEDDDAVRALARHVLRDCGYAVLEAANGEDALRVAAAYADPIHLLVSDVVMPRLGGRKLAERLETLKPGVKVLFCSGYLEDAILRHGVLEAAFAFLQKPFTPVSLACKVREVLDAKEQGRGNRRGPAEEGRPPQS